MTATLIAAVQSKRTLENTYLYAGVLVTVLFDGSENGGAFGLLDVTGRPGGEPPLHVHSREDETFFVVEGKLSVWVGGAVHHLEAGESIFLPRGVPHTFRAKSPVVRALNFITPSGFQEWFRILGEPADSFVLPEGGAPGPEFQQRVMSLSPKFGARILGPAPEF